jgi:hypothetical protein
LNGLFNTQGQDLLSSSMGFTIYDTDGRSFEINEHPDQAAKMVYTNVFYNQQQNNSSVQPNLISGEFVNRKDLIPNELHPEARAYNYDLDYLDLRETTYLITDTGNTNWYGNDYYGVIILMKQKLKDKDYINSVNIYGKFYPTSGQTSSSTSNITVEDLGKLNLRYEDGKYKLKSEFNCRCSVLSGANSNTYTWGSWESDKCEEDIINSSELSKSLILKYKKNNDYDITLKDLKITRAGIMKRDTSVADDYLVINQNYYVYFPYFNASRNRIKICKNKYV